MILNFGKFLKSVSRNRHCKYGLPFASLIIFGWYVLRQSQSVTYDLKKSEPFDREEFKKKGFKIKEKAPTLEDVYESIKELDIDNWENVRGPRLWDETPQN